MSDTREIACPVCRSRHTVPAVVLQLTPDETCWRCPRCGQDCPALAWVSAAKAPVPEPPGTVQVVPDAARAAQVAALEAQPDLVPVRCPACRGERIRVWRTALEGQAGRYWRCSDCYHSSLIVSWAAAGALAELEAKASQKDAPCATKAQRRQCFACLKPLDDPVVLRGVATLRSAWCDSPDMDVTLYACAKCYESPVDAFRIKSVSDFVTIRHLRRRSK